MTVMFMRPVAKPPKDGQTIFTYDERTGDITIAAWPADVTHWAPMPDRIRIGRKGFAPGAGLPSPLPLHL